MTKFTLQQLTQLVQGDLIGPEEYTITGIATPDEASKSDLIFLIEPRWLDAIQQSNSQVVLLPNHYTSDNFPNKYLIRVPHIRQALSTLLEKFETPAVYEANPHNVKIAPDVMIPPNSYIGSNSEIAEGVVLYPSTYIGPDCKIGKNCILYPQVTIRKHSVLGDNVVIHSGCVIGSDGYGYYQEDDKHYKIPQIGGVMIGDDVEIGANVTVDRGTVGNTTIGRGTKIDNMVHIGHNVQIGEDCLLIAQVGISGSTVIGDRVTLAGQVGVAGHLRIGDDVIAAGKSGITKDIPGNLKVSGFPAQEHLKELRFQAALRRVPDIFKWWKNFLSGKW